MIICMYLRNYLFRGHRILNWVRILDFHQGQEFFLQHPWGMDDQPVSVWNASNGAETISFTIAECFPLLILTFGPCSVFQCTFSLKTWQPPKLKTTLVVSVLFSFLSLILPVVFLGGPVRVKGPSRMPSSLLRSLWKHGTWKWMLVQLWLDGLRVRWSDCFLIQDTICLLKWPDLLL